MSTSKNIDRTNLLPKDALDLLVQGNQRFIKNEQQALVAVRRYVLAQSPLWCDPPRAGGDY